MDVRDLSGDPGIGPRRRQVEEEEGRRRGARTGPAEEAGTRPGEARGREEEEVGEAVEVRPGLATGEGTHPGR